MGTITLIEGVSNSAYSSSKGETIYCRIDGVNCENSLKLNGNDEIDYFVKVNSQGKIIELVASTSEYQYVNGNIEVKLSDEISSQIVSDITEEEKVTITKYGVVVNGQLVSNFPTITIKSNEVIYLLDLCAFDISSVTFNIETGAKIKQVFVKENNACKEISVEEFYKRVLPKTITSFNELKAAIIDGYRNLVVTSTLNVNGNQKLSPSTKAKITTNDKITIFKLSSGNSLTLEKYNYRWTK